MSPSISVTLIVVNAEDDTDADVAIALETGYAVASSMLL